MSGRREIRDPIHGFIDRNEAEERIIDTRAFQRLRQIKQLALANLVYPGAVHTRFDHSIGTMHVAGLLANRLVDDEESRRLVRLSALLHDVGHGPFSHVSEDLLDKYYDSSQIKPSRKEKIHELLTYQIIQEDPEIARLISEHERGKICDIMSGEGTSETILRNIISGPLDADKQDYLLRDSYFCGVKYGVFDLERLIGTLSIIPSEHDVSLSATSDGVHAIEQFVLAKYYMSTQVYRHKIRLVTDAMIVRGLELGLEKDKLDWLIDLYTYDGTSEFVRRYLTWDDQRLIYSILGTQGDGTLVASFFRRLNERNLFKSIFSGRLLDFENPAVRDNLSQLNKNSDVRNKLENEISEYLSSKFGKRVKDYEVLIVPYTIKSAKEQSRNNEGSIVIKDYSGNKKFEDVSTLFRSIDEKQNDQSIFIFVPLDSFDELGRHRLRSECRDDIIGILTRGVEENNCEPEQSPDGGGNDGR